MIQTTCPDIPDNVSVFSLSPDNSPSPCPGQIVRPVVRGPLVRSLLHREITRAFSPDNVSEPLSAQLRTDNKGAL